MQIDARAVHIALVEKGLNGLSGLADAANLSRNTVSSVVNGKSASASTIRKLADALGLSVREIIKEGY